MSEGPNMPGAGDPNAGQPQGGTPPPPQGGAPPPPQQPAPPAQQGAQAGVGIGQPADLMTRFLARVIDHVLLFIVQAIIVTTIIFGVIFSAASGGFGGMGGGFGFPGIISSVIAAAIYIGYFAYLESSRGQTLGKMLMKIQVQGPDGQHPSIEVAVKRNAWLALTIIPFLGWLLQLIATIYIAVTINNNTATRQGWHDEFAGGTKVIKIG